MTLNLYKTDENFFIEKSACCISADVHASVRGSFPDRRADGLGAV